MAAYEGIRARHARSCRSHTSSRCNCSPTFEAFVWSSTDGRKIRRSFARLSDAKAWRAEASHAVARGALRAPTRRTLADEVDDWIRALDAGEVVTRSGEPYKPATAREIRRNLESFVVPDIGSKRLAAVARRDVQAFVDRLTSSGLSGSSVRNVVNALKVVYRRARELDRVTADPTKEIRLPPAAGVRERAADPVEVAQLLGPLRADDQALWATAAYAGLRRGELRGLRWADVDLGANVITVVRGWDEKDGPIAPKSRKGARRVPIGSALRRLLLEHKARSGRRDDDLVFGASATSPFTPTAVRRRALTAWRKENERRTRDRQPSLNPIGLHELRHSYVSMMFAAGFTLPEIGDYIGHTSASMSDRYRHLLAGHEATASERFDRYLNATGAFAGAQGL